jgi:hypothetical protein
MVILIYGVGDDLFWDHHDVPCRYDTGPGRGKSPPMSPDPLVNPMNIPNIGTKGCRQSGLLFGLPDEVLVVQS